MMTMMMMKSITTDLKENSVGLDKSVSSLTNVPDPFGDGSLSKPSVRGHRPLSVMV
jgi:hypothetical protein